MSWAKIDDGFAFHRKVISVGNEAIGAWTRMLADACANLSNGFVPMPTALLIAGRQDILDALIGARLLDPADGGVRLHDFLDYNPKAQKVLARRANRAESGAKGGRAKAQSRRDVLAIARPVATPELAPVPAGCQPVATTVATQNPAPYPVPVSRSRDPVPDPGHPPFPPQAGGIARAREVASPAVPSEPPLLQVVEPVRQAARVRKPRAPAERGPDPPALPFRAAQAVAWIADGASGRFVAPDRLAPGHAIALEREIRDHYGAERAWRDLGAAIGVGEVSWNKPGPIPIGVLVSQLAAWMPVARAWVDRGRTAIEPASARPAWERPMQLPVMTRRERRPEDQAAVDALPPGAWERQDAEEKGFYG